MKNFIRQEKRAGGVEYVEELVVNRSMHAGVSVAIGLAWFSAYSTY